MKYDWTISDLLSLSVWPICVFTTLLIVCFVIFRSGRKKGNRTAKILTVVIPIIGWSIWHFYPSFTVQGTYIAKFQYLDGEEISKVVITDKFQYGDNTPVNYEINPLLRVLLIEPQGLYPAAAKLGWNSVDCYVFKVGMVKHKKEKQANQRVDPTVKTPVESGNEQGTAGHP